MLPAGEKGEVWLCGEGRMAKGEWIESDRRQVSGKNKGDKRQVSDDRKKTQVAGGRKKAKVAGVREKTQVAGASVES